MLRMFWEAAEASWIWTTKMHATKGGRMSPSFGGGGSYCREETLSGDRNINKDVKHRY